MANTRKNGRGIVSRVFNPVGKVVNMAGNVVKTGFKAAKNIGHHAVKGANKVINSVSNSVTKRGGGKRTRRRSSRRRH